MAEALYPPDDPEIAIREEHVGKGTQPTVASREVLGNVLREQGRHEAALEVYRVALADCRTLFKEPNPVTADVLVGLGRTLVAMDRAAEARPLLEQGLVAMRRRPGRPDPLIARAASRLDRLALAP